MAIRPSVICPRSELPVCNQMIVEIAYFGDPVVTSGFNGSRFFGREFQVTHSTARLAMRQTMRPLLGASSGSAISE